MSLCGIILGTRGQGKSTLAKAIARRFHTAVFYFDPNRQFYSPLCFSDADSLAEFLSSKPAHFEVVLRPTMGQVEDDFHDFIEAIRAAGIRENVAIVVDEASMLQSPHRMNPDLEWLVRCAPQSGREDDQGRAYANGWTVIQTSHRPVDYHNDVRALVSDWFILKTEHRGDIAWIVDNLPERIAEDVLEQIEHLERFHVVHVWSENGKTQFSVWRHPERWHVGITRRG